MVGFVYILTNANKTVLYTGVTNDIRARLQQHRSGTGSQFVKKYQAYYLVYLETYPTVPEAITREKAIKGMKREKKNALITAQNPEWCDRAGELMDI